MAARSMAGVTTSKSTISAGEVVSPSSVINRPATPNFHNLYESSLVKKFDLEGPLPGFADNFVLMTHNTTNDAVSTFH